MNDLITTKKIGKEAEDLACNHLKQQGLKLITRNYFCRAGEIDLIMQDKDCIVFVEVRYRKNIAFGSGLESINLSKQTKLIKTANYYLLQHHLTDKYPCRFDVISITSQQSKPQVEWVKNAFGAH